MFKSSKSLLPVAALAALCGLALGCTAGNGMSSEENAEQVDALRGRHHQNRQAAPTNPDATGGVGAAPSADPGGGDGSGVASSNSASALIAAAQTPDGRAIPQDANADGSCPAVVAALGFWSCFEQFSTCSFEAGGARHDCTCTPVSGEGQYPAWLCD